MPVAPHNAAGHSLGPESFRTPTSIFVFFNDTATTEIYTLSLHDALPISVVARRARRADAGCGDGGVVGAGTRSEEHTSELQSHSDLVCRLLLEKKKTAVSRDYSRSSLVRANPSRLTRS